MNTYKDPRGTLNWHVFMLAALVFVLAAGWALQALSKHFAARDMLAATEASDLIIHAASIQAMERGLTSAALGNLGKHTNGELRQELNEARFSGDRLWHDAEELIPGLIDAVPNSSQLSDYFLHTQLAFEALKQVRKRVDASFASGTPAIEIADWTHAVTSFIDQSALLRDMVINSVEVPAEVSMYNKTLKHWLWLASEHAGRERGMLSYYIGAGQPVPNDVYDDLKSYRSVVETNIRRINEYAAMPNMDPRIRTAIDEMNMNFIARYNSLRERVLKETATGVYSTTPAKWMEQSTAAINHILHVSATISEVSAEHVVTLTRRAAYQLVLSLLLLSLSVLMVVLYLGKVRRIANQLFHQKELAEVTLRSIGDAVITTDDKAQVEYLNPIAEELTGWSSDEAYGRPLKEVFHIVKSVSRQEVPNPVEECLREQRVVGMENGTLLTRRDGKEIHIEDSAAPIRNRAGEIVGAVMVFYDVTSIPNTPHLLSYHTTHDPITRLINRRELERRIEEHLIRAKNSGETHALCYLDIDQFKVINDTCGHTAGDRLLRQFADYLRGWVRQTDTLARLGGDEFGLLLEGCDLTKAQLIAEGMRQAIRNFRFTWEGKTFEMRASIGLVPITEHSKGVSELLGEADAACYAAKESGRDALQVYVPNNVELTRTHDAMHWVSRITLALKENRFCLYGQLILPLNDAHAPHLEVLVRMKDEQGNLVPPMKFIPAAERFNLMQEIDRWVVHNTFALLEAVCRRHHNLNLHCNINISGASLGRENFHEFMEEVLSGHRVPASMICLEITETAAMSNLKQVADFIESMRTTGCKFALDDFGSGLSSFNYLRNLPVDYLKIDGNLIQGIAEDPVTYGMVQAIQRVGHIMGIQTVAEYVSNAAILDKIREIEIDYAQGYHVSEPFPLSVDSLADIDVTAARFHASLKALAQATGNESLLAQSS